METCDMEIISKVRRGQYLGGKFADKLIQSVTFDGQYYYIGFSWMDNAKLSTVVKAMDLSFTEDSVIDITNHAYRHINDMEFNPADGLIYVVDGGNHIFVMDRDMEPAYSYDLPCYVWSLARYPDGDWFVFDGKTAYRYNRNFTKHEVIRTGLPFDGCWQGAVMMDGAPYLILSGRQERPDHYDGNFLYSLFGESIWFPGDREIEGAVIVGDRMDFVYGQLKFGGATWDMQTSVKTVFGTVEGVKTKADTFTLDCSGFVPEGYKLTAAEVSFKKGNAWRTVPYFSDGVCWMNVYKVSGSKVTLLSSKDFGTTDFQVTGFCRRE